MKLLLLESSFYISSDSCNVDNVELYSGIANYLL